MKNSTLQDFLTTLNQLSVNEKGENYENAPLRDLAARGAAVRSSMQIFEQKLAELEALYKAAPSK